MIMCVRAYCSFLTDMDFNFHNFNIVQLKSEYTRRHKEQGIHVLLLNIYTTVSSK